MPKLEEIKTMMHKELGETRSDELESEKENKKFKLLAIIMAGGSGIRMGAIGQLIPTVFLPIGLDPVINAPLKRCIDSEDIKEIFILTKKSLPDVNLEMWANNWIQQIRDTNLIPEKKVVRNIFEEDLKPHYRNNKICGSVVALQRFVSSTEIHDQFDGDCSEYPTHLLIVAGDNYISSDFLPLINAAKSYPDSVIIATRNITEHQNAINNYAVIGINKRSESIDEKSKKITLFKEKPDNFNVDYTEFSLGLYCIPIKLIKKEADTYIKGQLELNAEAGNERLGPPGYFLEYLFNKYSDKFRSVPFEEGHWIDVGTPSSYLESIIKVTTDLIKNPRNARELVALGSTDMLSDRSYFLCDKIKIQRGNQGKPNEITLTFHGDDKVATSDNFEQIKYDNDNLEKNNELWDYLENTETHEVYWDAKKDPKKLGSEILISGGVFLLDRADKTKYERGSARVPLLLRDINAPVDALRLTTPAGRMDKLDLVDVCFSEMAEEMIFFGGCYGGKILVCSNKDYSEKVRRIIAAQILEKKIKVPAIDPLTISLIKDKSKSDVFEEHLGEIIPPPSEGETWTVKIEFKNDGENVDESYTCNNMILIPDRYAATLEFRFFLEAPLTVSKTGEEAEANFDLSSIGILRGIVDGDGHGRTVFFVSAQELFNYYEKRKNVRYADVAFKSDNPNQDGLKILAMTDASTGRFVLPNKKRSFILSNALFTTAVSKMIEML